jgi:Zn-dependent protease with chaperone function
MDILKFAAIALALAATCLEGCATAPSGDRERMAGLPLAATHSDISFMLTTGARQRSACNSPVRCERRDNGPASMPTPFDAQVQRVAGVLQQAARRLYPDLERRIPRFASDGFDVYVATGEEPMSGSSASGRIALNSALGAWRPYDDWLAFVIAREMGHVIALHHEENSSVSLVISAAMSVLLPGSGFLKTAASTFGSRFAIGSARDKQALEADEIAIQLLREGGYRLNDVVLSLAIAPAMLDDGTWARSFKRSADSMIAQVRASQFSVASHAPGASGIRQVD